MQIKSGGVAKTTTVANLGNCLVRNGKKVLLIDFDPQADLTSSLGFKNADGMEHTIKTLMEKIITKQPIDKKEAIITNEENIDLVPSNIELEALEASMINFENRENILRNYISKVKDDYDYIDNVDGNIILRKNNGFYKVVDNNKLEDTTYEYKEKVISFYNNTSNYSIAPSVRYGRLDETTESKKKISLINYDKVMM